MFPSATAIRRGPRQWLLLLGALGLLLAGSPANAETQEVYYPNGMLKARIHTRTSRESGTLRHGGFEGFHASGSRAVEGAYLHGVAVGIWVWWDQRGNVIRRVRKDGAFEELLFGQEFNSPKTVFRNTAKRKISEGQLKFDKGHGPWSYFFDDGTPQAEGGFLTGIPDGRWTVLYGDGQIRSIEDYKLGIPHGLYMKAYPSGQEQVEGRLDQGLKVGVWRFWHPDGRKKAEGKYLNDLEEEEWRFWDENGALEKRLVYRAGRLIARLPIPKKPDPRATEVIPRPMQQIVERPLVFDEDGLEIHEQQ